MSVARGVSNWSEQGSQPEVDKGTQCLGEGDQEETKWSV